MRGAALPAALLCAALGLLLAFASWRAILCGLALLVTTSVIAAHFIPVDGRMIELAFIGCWISMIVIAAGVHLPWQAPLWLTVAAAVDAGFWSGAVIAGEGARLDLARALPCVLIVIPARWIVGRGWQIGVKVVSSWLIAVALLAALLPTAVTPGYVPDHMD